MGGKRVCKSKYRNQTIDSPESGSPRSLRTSIHQSGSISARDESGNPNRSSSRRSNSSSSSDHFEVSNSPDNIHSPYHLHSSDHPGLVLVAELLDGTNFGTWIIAMTTSLEAKNKLGFLDGSIVKPAETDPCCKIWSRCNNMLKPWLLNSVSKKIYTSILYLKNASDIWKDLHTRFHKSNLPVLYKLHHQIHSLRQGSLDLSSYHTQTQSLWEELTSIQSTPRTVEDLIAERETNRVIDFFMGLNENYESIRSRILMKKTLPSLSEVYNLLDQEDSQRSARFTLSGDIEASAFVVPQPQPSGSSSTISKPLSHQTSSGGRSFGNFRRRDRPVCSFCGRMGHVVDRCYKKHGFPTGFESQQRVDKPSSIMANITVGECSPESAVSDDLFTAQIQELVSFLSSKFQPPISSPAPEVHSVSVVPDLSSSTVCPISGSYIGINDWIG